MRTLSMVILMTAGMGGFGQPQKPTVGGKDIDSDEYIDAREEKFKKILTPDPAGVFVN